MAKDKVYTADMGQPPMDPEVAPKNPKPSKKDMPEQLGEGIVVNKAKETDATRDALQKFRAEKKGITVEQMRKDAANEFDKRVKAGDLYKRGGMTASSRADGIATKGKTRGTMVTMCGGGMYKK